MVKINLIEFCDHCGESLITMEKRKDAQGREIEVRTEKPGVIEEKHLSIDHVGFCCEECYKDYWRDKKIYAPEEVKLKWRLMGLFQDEKEDQ